MSTPGIIIDSHDAGCRALYKTGGEGFFERADQALNVGSVRGDIAQLFHGLHDFELPHSFVPPQGPMKIAHFDSVGIAQTNAAVSLANQEFRGCSAQSIAAEQPHEGVTDGSLVKPLNPFLPVGPVFAPRPLARQTSGRSRAKILQRR